MTEISKIKIGFALALLAALFTLSPMANETELFFTMFSMEIKIRILYWIFVLLLAFSVYFYALALINEEKVHDISQKLGNYIYVMALLFPLLVLSIYIISTISTFLIGLSNSKLTGQILQLVLYTILGAYASILVQKIATKFRRVEDKQISERSKKVEIQLLEKAKKLSQTEMYDLSVIELWKALEMSFERTFSLMALPYDRKNLSKMIDLIKQYKLLPSTLLSELHSIRNIRNKAAHTSDIVSKVEIQNAIKITEKILATIDGYKEKCYYCNNRFPLTELDVEDINGDYYVCKDCAMEHPNWKNEIFVLGMDP